MNRRRLLRIGAKVAHEMASIGFGGALAACLIINHAAAKATPAEFLAGRQIFGAIAQYVLVPSMFIVVISGFIALVATRGYADAGWAWLKALLGLSVFEATMMVVGSSRKQAELIAATADPATLETLLRAERNTMWLLIVISAVNVLLAVWRPKMSSGGR